ncbi:MAG: hypothetical protein ACYC8T_24800 [Myxococcaceae bacterium]
MKAPIESMRLLYLALAVALVAAAPAFAQYNDSAAKSAPTETVKIGAREVTRPVAPDGWGNAAGNDYDLARDRAFEGQSIAVIQLYTQEGFDFSLPRAALAEKGFKVQLWSNRPPSPEELQKALEKSCQLWIISGSNRQLDERHLAVIKKFFDAGHGVYIWGDNDPYFADANYLASALLGTQMSGDVPGGVTVGLQRAAGKTGVLQDHLLTTGLEQLFEGVTIATVAPTQTLRPLLFGSAGNLVSAFHDRDGRRAILDGGFTRLYIKWDTAGTARYVKNSAAWLVNVERFGVRPQARR